MYYQKLYLMIELSKIIRICMFLGISVLEKMFCSLAFLGLKTSAWQLHVRPPPKKTQPNPEGSRVPTTKHLNFAVVTRFDHAKPWLSLCSVPRVANHHTPQGLLGKGAAPRHGGGTLNITN